LIFFFYFEKKIHQKFSLKFSAISIFFILSTIFTFFSYSIKSIDDILNQNASKNFHFRQLRKKMFDYSKIYAPKKDDAMLVFAPISDYQFPLLNYLEKENPNKFYIATIQANHGLVGSGEIFPKYNSTKLFTYSYLLNDTKNALLNSNTKLVFVDNSLDDLNKKNQCLIGNLEYYFLDKEFKKIFLQNFSFRKRIIINQKIESEQLAFSAIQEKLKNSNATEPSSKKILYDFEVYVRKN
jgi:hypothetical protein